MYKWDVKVQKHTHKYEKELHYSF